MTSFLLGYSRRPKAVRIASLVVDHLFFSASAPRDERRVIKKDVRVDHVPLMTLDGILKIFTYLYRRRTHSTPFNIHSILAFLLLVHAMGKTDAEVIALFEEQVNMTADELETWLDNPQSHKAGTGVGIESGRRIVEILRKNPDKNPDGYDEVRTLVLPVLSVSGCVAATEHFNRRTWRTSAKSSSEFLLRVCQAGKVRKGGSLLTTVVSVTIAAIWPRRIT